MSRVTKFETELRAAFERTAGPENVTLALRLMTGRYADNELDDLPAVVELRHQCYSDPGHHYKLMTALDSLLGTHGIEHLGSVDMRDGPPVEYLNTGDSYAATVCWFRDLAPGYRFKVCGWADALEWCERRYGRTENE